MSAFEEAEKSQTSDCQTGGQLAQDKIFEEFCGDRESIEGLGVTPQELQASSRRSLLGTLTCKKDMLFILRQIRETVKPPENEPSIPDVREMTETLRRAALARLIELDPMNAAKRGRTAWSRIKMTLGWRNHLSPSYRTN